MDSGARDGKLPQIVRMLFPTFGAHPLGMLLTGSIRALARRQPRLFDRLGAHRSVMFFINPTDLAFAFTIVPDGEKTQVRVTGKAASATADVVIKGPILMLLGLLDGSLDGDALFFHRIISVSGRTEAVVALRNTIEEAELRPADLLGIHGALARFTDATILGALSAARRLTAGGSRPAVRGS